MLQLNALIVFEIEESVNKQQHSPLGQNGTVLEFLLSPPMHTVMKVVIVFSQLKIALNCNTYTL